MVERVDAGRHAIGIDVDDQVHAGLGGHAIAEGVHVTKLPGRIDMHQREGRRRRMERLGRQMQHDGGILADRIKHDRIAALGRDLADDVQAFCLKALGRDLADDVQAFCLKAVEVGQSFRHELQAVPAVVRLPQQRPGPGQMLPSHSEPDARRQAVGDQTSFLVMVKGKWWKRRLPMGVGDNRRFRQGSRHRARTAIKSLTTRLSCINREHFPNLRHGAI